VQPNQVVPRGLQAEALSAQGFLGRLAADLADLLRVERVTVVLTIVARRPRTFTEHDLHGVECLARRRVPAFDRRDSRRARGAVA
jgi:hypothetical protein